MLFGGLTFSTGHTVATHRPPRRAVAQLRRVVERDGKRRLRRLIVARQALRYHPRGAIGPEFDADVMVRAQETLYERLLAERRG